MFDSGLELQMKQFAWIIAGVFVVGSCIVSFIVIWQHLRNYKMATVQKFAIRIILMIPIFAIMSYLSLIFKDLAFFFNVARDTYEAYVLYMFFRLLIELAEGEENLIAQLEELPEIKYLAPLCCFHIKPGRIFLHRCKQFILQYVIVKLILTIATFILEICDVFHEGSFSPKSGYLYITIVYNISISLSLYFLVLFYESIKVILKPYKPLSKFICIKSIVFFTFWQGLAISMMVYSNFVLTGFDDYTVTDIAVALQSFLICIEMFPLAVMHAKTFGYKSFANVRVKELANQDFVHVMADSFALHDVILDTITALKKGPQRNVNVGSFLLVSKEEQLQRVMKQAWLKKRGEDLVKKWKKRYFLLISEPLGLVYFKYNPFLRADSDHSNLKARGFIAMSEMIGIVEKGKHGEGEFIIVTHRRKWHIKASDAQERDDWVKTLKPMLPKPDLPKPEKVEIIIDHQELEKEIYDLSTRLKERDDLLNRQRARIQYLESRLMMFDKEALLMNPLLLDSPVSSDVITTSASSSPRSSFDLTKRSNSRPSSPLVTVRAASSPLRISQSNRQKTSSGEDNNNTHYSNGGESAGSNSESESPGNSNMTIPHNSGSNNNNNMTISLLDDTDDDFTSSSAEHSLV